MAKAKKPVIPEPTKSQVTIVFMGSVDTVDEAEIEKKLRSVERAVQKHIPGMAMDTAYGPIVEWPELTPAQKEAVREHIMKEYSEPVPIAGAAVAIRKTVAAAAGSFFS